MGNGTDLLNGAIGHSKRQTQNGFLQDSTEIVELQGDLIGRILYHVTSTIDLTNDTLNTGDHVFSRTIANSEPVMIHVCWPTPLCDIQIACHGAVI